MLGTGLPESLIARMADRRWVGQPSTEALMDIVGIDIAKAKFDVALLMDERARHAAFPNSEAGAFSSY